MKLAIKSILSAISTTLLFILGGWDIALQSLIVVMIIDYLTGISKSYVAEKLNSNKGFKGIVKKLAMLGLVAIAVIIDRLVGDTGLIRTFLIYYLVANEGLSIIENLGEMDIIVPEFLKKRLEQLKDKGDQE
jgi:toxin secretion/phage lysis holin